MSCSAPLPNRANSGWRTATEKMYKPAARPLMEKWMTGEVCGNKFKQIHQRLFNLNVG